MTAKKATAKKTIKKKVVEKDVKPTKIETTDVEPKELTNLDNDVLIGEGTGEALEEIKVEVGESAVIDAEPKDEDFEVFDNIEDDDIIKAVTGVPGENARIQLAPKLKVLDFSTIYPNRIPNRQNFKKHYDECLIVTRSRLDLNSFEVWHLRHDTVDVLNSVAVFYQKEYAFQFCDGFEAL